MSFSSGRSDILRFGDKFVQLIRLCCGITTFTHPLTIIGMIQRHSTIIHWQCVQILSKQFTNCQLLIIIYHRNLHKCFTNSPQLTSSPYLSLLKDRGHCVLVSNMDDSLNGIVSHLPIFAHQYPVRVESTYSDIHFQFCCFIVLFFLLPRNSSRSISIWLGISLARLLCPLKTNN